jgi:hypothetical protein
MTELRKVKSITSELVKESFQSLSPSSIIFIPVLMTKYTASAWWLPPFRFIFINPRRLKEDNHIIRSVLAHELCHFELFKKMGWWEYILDLILYYTSSSKRRKVERNTDKLAIEKGYSHELYEYAKKFREGKDIGRWYLSAAEIKRYAKQRGVW